MDRPRVRPTFEVSSPLSRKQVRERVAASLVDVRGTIVGTFIGDSETIELVPHSSLVHSWSPQLRLDLSDVGDGTRIHARFAPHPHIWSLYLAVHALGAFGTLGAAMVGVSQHLAGQSPWALWALPIAPVLAALVWAFAFVGQGLGGEQMYLLRRFVEDTIADPREEGTAPADTLDRAASTQ